MVDGTAAMADRTVTRVDKRVALADRTITMVDKRVTMVDKMVTMVDGTIAVADRTVTIMDKRVAIADRTGTMFDGTPCVPLFRSLWLIEPKTCMLRSKTGVALQFCEAMILTWRALYSASPTTLTEEKTSRWNKPHSLGVRRVLSYNVNGISPSPQWLVSSSV